MQIKDETIIYRRKPCQVTSIMSVADEEKILNLINFFIFDTSREYPEDEVSCCNLLIFLQLICCFLYRNSKMFYTFIRRKPLETFRWKKLVKQQLSSNLASMSKVLNLFSLLYVHPSISQNFWNKCCNPYITYKENKTLYFHSRTRILHGHGMKSNFSH